MPIRGTNIVAKPESVGDILISDRALPAFNQNLSHFSREGLVSSLPGTKRKSSLGTLNTPTPYAEQWVLDVQQALSKDLTINMSYFANRGRKQQQSREGGIDYDQLPTSDFSYGSSLSDQIANLYYGFINVAPFNSPTIARSQLLRRYSLRGPGLNSTDLSLFKDFGAAERVKVQFRAEAFNVFNHVQFSNPNTSVTSTSFGAINLAGQQPASTAVQLGASVLNRSSG